MKMLGILLIILSYVKWAIIPFVHLFQISGAWKAVIYTGLLIGAEVLFWGGSIIIGVESARQMRKIPSFILWLKGRFAKKIYSISASDKD